jgi:hypothetical protein
MSGDNSINSPDDDNTSGVMVGGSDIASETSQPQEATETSKETSEDDKKDSTPAEPQLPFGSVAESKDLYAKIDKDGNQSWVSELPDDVDEAAENEETKKYAVIVRKSEL